MSIRVTGWVTGGRIIITVIGVIAVIAVIAADNYGASLDFGSPLAAGFKR
jgi:hypothetical protein